MNSFIRALIIALISEALLFSLACSKQDANWTGKTYEEDGVVVVKNPSKPIYEGNPCSFELEVSIGNNTRSKDDSFTEIGSIAVDENENIYVSDIKESHIKVFNQRGTYLRTIGKKGQGPGEFDYITRIELNRESQLVVFDGNTRRISFFTPDGKLIANLSTKEIAATDLILDSTGRFLAISFGIDLNKNEAITELKLFNSDQSFIKTIITSDPASIFNPFSPFIQRKPYKNGNYLCAYNKNYELLVYDPEWQLKKKITKDYVPEEITSEEKKTSLKMYPQLRTMGFPSKHPAFSQFTIDDDDRVYVQTWEMSEKENVYYYDVFDALGRYVAKVPFRHQPRLWKKGKLYTIEESIDGFQLIRIYKVTWDLKSF